jgi:hypothetical protein
LKSLVRHRGRVLEPDTAASFVGGDAAGPVDQREFVGVEVESGQHRVGVGDVGGRRSEQLSLRADRHVFAGAHRQRAGQQPGQAGQSGQQDGGRGRATAGDAEHQGQVADQAVVGAEHRGPEGA